MPSFSIPLSGLSADSTALNTIANNLSNMNTTAFKSQTTTFADLFYQGLGVAGSGDPIVSGLGTRVSSTESNFTSGSINSTGNTSDMAINGDGFFVAQQSGGTQYLTRAGNFTVNQNGNLVTTDGLQVLGYPAVNGAAAANGSVAPILIPTAAVEAPQATANMGLQMNLDPSTPAGTSAPVQTIKIYDSLGAAHEAAIAFTKTTTPNQWNYSIDLPAGEYSGAAANNTGTLTFDGSGKLISPTGNVAGVSFAGLADGANNMNFTFNLLDANKNSPISQVSGASASGSTTQDGYASGKYSDFSVDQNGVISAQFDNGHTVALAQLAIARVTNEQGLSRVGGNNYQTTAASGQANLGTAGNGGRGAVKGASLEASNVDISSEFANLIVAQRAFEANSKSITTFDTVTQDTINMIR